MNIAVPRLSTGVGSNIPGLHRPEYGNLVLPQAGTLPAQRDMGQRGAGLGQAPGDPEDPDPPDPIIETRPDDPDPDVIAPDFSVTVTETVFPWELLFLGVAAFFLMDERKKGGRNG